MSHVKLSGCYYVLSLSETLVFRNSAGHIVAPNYLHPMSSSRHSRLSTSHPGRLSMLGFHLSNNHLQMVLAPEWKTST